MNETITTTGTYTGTYSGNSVVSIGTAVTYTDSDTFTWEIPKVSTPYRSFYVMWNKTKRVKDFLRLQALGVLSLIDRVHFYNEDEYKIKKHVVKALKRRGILIPIISC